MLFRSSKIKLLRQGDTQNVSVLETSVKVNETSLSDNNYRVGRFVDKSGTVNLDGKVTLPPLVLISAALTCSLIVNINTADSRIIIIFLPIFFLLISCYINILSDGVKLLCFLRISCSYYLHAVYTLNKSVKNISLHYISRMQIPGF